MALILPQPLHHVLAPKLPQCRLLSTASNIDNLDIYTFTNMDIGGFGGGHPFGAHENVVTATPLLASAGRRAIFAIIHGEDANATFNVSTVTIGGVGGTELVDRGGAANPINSSIYGWSDQALAGIANTDVVVTWSESILACAVGIVEVTNLRSFGAVATSSSTNAGLIALVMTFAVDENNIGGMCIVGSTCATGGGTEQPSFEFNPNATDDTSAFFPTMLYYESNAEIDFAAAYYPVPTLGLAAARLAPSVLWSGAGAGDAAGVFLL